MRGFDILITLSKIPSMHFISEELEDYIERHSEKEPELLAALNKEKSYCLAC